MFIIFSFNESAQISEIDFSFFFKFQNDLDEGEIAKIASGVAIEVSTSFINFFFFLKALK